MKWVDFRSWRTSWGDCQQNNRQWTRPVCCYTIYSIVFYPILCQIPDFAFLSCSLAVENQWHCLSSLHMPAMCPTPPQLLQTLGSRLCLLSPKVHQVQINTTQRVLFEVSLANYIKATKPCGWSKYPSTLLVGGILSRSLRSIAAKKLGRLGSSDKALNED